MQTFLSISGVAAWIGVALIGAAIGVRRLLRSRVVQTMLHTPRFAPYLWLSKYRIAGFVMNRRYRGKVPPEVIKAHQEVKLSEMKTLRDVYTEIDRLPTIEKGKAALGLKSVFEIPLKRVHRIPSAYTHPMQYPPFYIPGVPAHNFYDPREFEWTKPLEEAFPIIKEELLGVLAEQGAGFKAYMTEGNTRIAGWNTFNFFFYGKKFEENCARCPRTTAILESLPRFERDHIMFSSLNPHSRISPHVGPMNGIVRAHLPLIVPPGCYIRVGSEERTWQEGKILAFDDSFEHEVFNHSDHVRIVLFLNFWHPCFQEREIPVLERFRHAYEASPLSRVHERNQQALRKHDVQAPAVAAAVA